MTDCEARFGDLTVAYANYDDFQLFKAAEFITDYAFPFPEATEFGLTEKTMLTDIPFLVDELLTFATVEEIQENSHQSKQFHCHVRMSQKQ